MYATNIRRGRLLDFLQNYIIVILIRGKKRKKSTRKHWVKLACDGRTLHSCSSLDVVSVLYAPPPSPPPLSLQRLSGGCEGRGRRDGSAVGDGRRSRMEEGRLEQEWNGRDGRWRNDDPGPAVRSARYQLPSKSIAVGEDVRRG